jgi:Sec7 domain
MAKERATSQPRQFSAEPFSYVSQTEVETTVTRTTTITTFFPAMKGAPPYSEPTAQTALSKPHSNKFENKLDNGKSWVEKGLPATPNEVLGTVSSVQPSHSPRSQKHQLRRATSHTTLSLAHVSFGIGVTPVAPMAISTSYLNLQRLDPPVKVADDLLRESPSQTAPNRSSQNSPKANGLNSGRPTRRRGLSLFGTRHKPGKEKRTGDYPSSVSFPDSSAIERKEDPLSDHGEAAGKRPLLWRLRVASFGPASQRSSRAQSPEPITTVPSNTISVARKHFLKQIDGEQPGNPIRSSSATPIYSTACDKLPDTDQPEKIINQTFRTLPNSRHTRRRSHTISLGSSPAVLFPKEQVPRSSSSSTVLSSSSFGDKFKSRRIETYQRPSSSQSLHTREGTRGCLPVIEQDLLEDPPNSEIGICLGQLLSSVSKSEALNILASSKGQSQIKALQNYMEQFDFSNEPIDVALRSMLAETGLPKETQQIDRVLEAFAKRYCLCNQNLFANEGEIRG